MILGLAPCLCAQLARCHRHRDCEKLLRIIRAADKDNVAVRPHTDHLRLCHTEGQLFEENEKIQERKWMNIKRICVCLVGPSRLSLNHKLVHLNTQSRAGLQICNYTSYINPAAIMKSMEIIIPAIRNSI